MMNQIRLNPQKVFFMKRILINLILALAVTGSQAWAAAIKPEVSETVELLSALARTAGYEEYRMDAAGQYTRDTEEWFAPFKEHPTVGYFQNLRGNYGISYNAPMDLAISLVIDGGKIKLAGDKKYLDPRWTNVNLDDVLAKLNEFYTDTRFHEFFMQHKAFYDNVLQDYETNVMQYFHQEWYAPFYGTESSENFRVVIGFNNGGSNYGPSRQMPGQPVEVFAICGYYVDKQTGKAFEDGMGYASTLIHEFNHSFVNHLYDNYKATMKPIAENLYDFSAQLMQWQAYSEPRTVFNESVVRAAVILYLKDNGFPAELIKKELDMNMSRGFAWMPELVSAMQDYSKQRSKYPTLNDFYPQIAQALSKYINTEQKRSEKAITALATLPRLDNQSPVANTTCKAEVMETVELMAILSRAAQYEEYCYDMAGKYSEDIEQWFGQYGQHPAVTYHQGLRNQFGIAYDAPMSLAVRLQVKDGKVVKIEEDPTAEGTGLDNRWDNVDMDEFLGLLNQFYTDTRFHEFFVQHQPFYQKELDAYNTQVMPQFDPEGSMRFFGMKRTSRPRAIIGFANGGNGYGAYSHPLGQSPEVFALSGYYDMNGQKPYMNAEQVLSTLNGMLGSAPTTSMISDRKTAALIDKIASRLYEMKGSSMSMYGYSNGNTAINKSLEAASDIIGMAQQGYRAQAIQEQMANYINRGFTWMPELVTALGDYALHRNKYKTFIDFYPQLAKVLNKYLDNEQKRIDKALK